MTESFSKYQVLRTHMGLLLLSIFIVFCIHVSKITHAQMRSNRKKDSFSFGDSSVLCTEIVLCSDL